MGNPVSHFIGDFPDGAAPVLPVFQGNPDTAGIDAVPTAHHGHVVLGLRHLGEILLQLGDDCVGTLDAGVGGKLDLHVEAAFIGAGHVFPADNAQGHHGGKDDKGQGHTGKELFLMEEAPVEGFGIEILDAVFYAVHGAPELRIRYLETFPEEAGRQHGGQSEGNEKGKEGRKNDGEAELPEELPGHAGHEGNRQVHHHVADGNGNGGHTDFHTSVHRLRQMAVDIFQNHDGVIHQNAYT